MKWWAKAKRILFVGRSVRVGRDFHLGLFSWITAPKSLIIGNDVYVGKMCTIQCNGVIGDGVLIGNNVGIVGRLDHDYRQVGVLMRHASWVGTDKRLQDDPRNAVAIGSDVWIGYGSTILSGVTIGRGAVIAAGSVVRSNVAAYDIVSGNPAVPVGHRFTTEQIEVHEKVLASKLNGPP